MQVNLKTKNNKKLKVKSLVNSRYTHTRIDKQLVKDKKIPTKPINFSFEVFKIDGMKNREVTKVVSRSLMVDFIFYSLFTLFYFSSCFSFIFYF